MQEFGPWEPDRYLVNSASVAEASGVVPKANSYGPLLQPAAQSIAAGTVIRGAFTARTSTDAIKIYAFSATKAYHYAGISSAWDDYTRLAGGDYTLAADDYWVIKQFGDTLIAVDGTGADAPQFIAVDAGTAFAALAGSPPKSKTVEIIGDYVFLGNTATSARSIKNSGLNDAATWTTYSKGSDTQTFQDGGNVQGIAGYEIGGLVFQTETVRRLSLRTDAAVFETHRIDAARGTASPYSIVKDGSDVYYYTYNGFMRIGGDGSIANIGIDRVNDWFAENQNISRPKAIIGALDPLVRRIFWLFATRSNASSTTLDHLIVYDIARDRWTHATTALTYIFTSAAAGVTLSALAALYTTLTAVPYPFGSDAWRGGAPGIAAFDANKKFCLFTGTPMMASVQTSGFELVPGSRGYINGFRLIGDAVNATAQVGGAERPQSAIVFNGPQLVNAQGRVPARLSARYAQIQVDLAAGEDWNDLQGVDFDQGDIRPDGKR